MMPPPVTGAGDGNRTHASSLGSCSSTIELHPHAAPVYARRGRLATRDAGRAGAGVPASEPAADRGEGGGLLAALLAGVQAHAEVGVEAEHRGARADRERGV